MFGIRCPRNKEDVKRLLAKSWWVPLALVPAWVVTCLIVVYVGHVKLTDGITVMASVAAALAIVGAAALTSWYAYSMEQSVEGAEEQLRVQKTVLEEMQRERELRYSTFVQLILCRLQDEPMISVRNLGPGAALEIHCHFESAGQVPVSGYVPCLLAGEQTPIILKTPDGAFWTGATAGGNIVIEYYGVGNFDQSYRLTFTVDDKGQIKHIDYGKVAKESK